MRRLATIAAVVAAALGATAPGARPASAETSRPITFPVAGDVDYVDTFGAPRSGGRTHEGQDLIGTKMQPLLAAADGTITWITITEASYGYMLTITGDDGWKYHYVHINNDTPGTDDGQADLADVFAPGIERGARVRAGQLVAYMGDSGNAEASVPQLHFELEDPAGNVVNPYASLLAAARAEPTVAGDDADLARVAGADRIATAVAASRHAWPDGSAAAVVARGDVFAEVLPASVLAADLDAPLLLTSASGIRDDVLAELDRLGATAVTVVGSVPPAIDGVIRSRGAAVTRIAGGTPAETAAAVARTLGAADGTAVLVNGDRFADAVSAAGLAAGRGWPILLSGGSRIPQVSVDTWRALGVQRIIVVGGTAVLSEAIGRFVPGGTRVAGADRYATSVAAAELSLSLGGRSLAATWLATGADYPDALTAGALAARTQGAVMLIDGTGEGGDIASRSFLSRQRDTVGTATVLGGLAAVTSRAAAGVASVIIKS